MGERNAREKVIGLVHRLMTFGFRLLPLATCLVPLVLSGCGLASFNRLSVNDPIKQEDVAFIELGHTTLTQVVAKLGTPDEMISLGDDEGVVAFYHFLDAKYTRINYGWPLQFVSLVPVDMILAGGGLGTNMFLVMFDRQWIAKQQSFAKHMLASRHRLWPFKDN